MTLLSILWIMLVDASTVLSICFKYSCWARCTSLRCSIGLFSVWSRRTFLIVFTCSSMPTRLVLSLCLLRDMSLSELTKLGTFRLCSLDTRGPGNPSCRSAGSSPARVSEIMVFGVSFRELSGRKALDLVMLDLSLPRASCQALLNRFAILETSTSCSEACVLWSNQSSSMSLTSCRAVCSR